MMSQNSLGFPSSILKQNMQIRKYNVTECCGVPNNIIKYNMQMRKYMKSQNSVVFPSIILLIEIDHHQSTTITVDFKKTAIHKTTDFLTMFQ